MKTEAQLLDELRANLAQFETSSLRLVRVTAADFPCVDLDFYERTHLALVNLNFDPAGDFDVVTGHPSDHSMRCFIRALIAHDGVCVAACYHPRPRFWMAVLTWLIAGRLGKVIEFETELSDDTLIVSTTCPKMRLFDVPPLILREHYPEKTAPAVLHDLHRHRVSVYLKAHPNVAIRKVHSVEGLQRMQARDHQIKAVYRGMVGGLTAEEIRRFSLFGRTRSAQLKVDLDSLSARAENRASAPN